MLMGLIGATLGVGKIFSGIVFYFLWKTILKNTKYDVLGKNELLDKVSIISIPGCFMIGDEDGLVDQEKFKEMFANFGSEWKTLRIMENTGHGDFRD